MNFKKLSAALATVALVGLSGAANATADLTFNPSASNGDAANKTIYAGQTAFTFQSIQTTLGSQLDISAASGTNVSWAEAGHLIFNTYDNGSQFQGNRVYAGGKYDIYGIFTGTGLGDWGPAPNSYTVTSISTFSLKLYASPNSGTGIVAGTPTSGTQANGGITAGSKDFLLGTAIFGGSLGGTSAQLGFGNTAQTQLTANFLFTPASAAYVDVGGFFEAPAPFNLTLFASGSSNNGQSTYSIDEGGVHIVTGNRRGATGNITAISAVPEPTALSLVGLALVGAAVASRKQKAKSA